jgi:pumilio RNA-binding family
MSGVGTFAQKEVVYTIITERLLDLASNTYGCRVVQKAFDEARTNGETSLLLQLVSGLRGHVIETIMDGNGNHVIQKCFEAIPMTELEFIVREVEQNVKCYVDSFVRGE